MPSELLKIPGDVESKIRHKLFDLVPTYISTCDFMWTMMGL